MTEPVRWLAPGSNPPEGARELLSELSPPPRMESMVRARVGLQIAEHAREEEPARLAPGLWLAAAFVGAACAAGAAFIVGPFRSDDVAPIATPPPPAQKADAPAQHVPEPEIPEETVEETVEEREETVEREEQIEERIERVEERTERRTVRRERRQPRREVRRAPVPVPVAEFGTLSINTTPWARIYIDGEDVGLTPIVRRRIPAGVHDIRMEADNGTVMRLRVTVRPDQDTRIIHQLGASSGSVNVLMR